MPSFSHEDEERLLAFMDVTRELSIRYGSAYGFHSKQNELHTALKAAIDKLGEHITGEPRLFAALSGVTAILATSLTRLAGDLPQYESTLREKARSLKFATSGGGTIEKAANVLKDLQTELEQPPHPSLNSSSSKPIPVEIRERGFGPLDPVVTAVALLIHPMTQIGIVILMVVLILFNREDLRNRLIRLAGTGDLHRTTTALDDAGHRLRSFSPRSFL